MDNIHYPHRSQRIPKSKALLILFSSLLLKYDDLLAHGYRLNDSLHLDIQHTWPAHRGVSICTHQQNLLKFDLSFYLSYFLINLVFRLSVQQYHRIGGHLVLPGINLDNREYAVSLGGSNANCRIVDDKFLFLFLRLLSLDVQCTGRLAFIYLILACLSFFFSSGFFHNAINPLYFLFCIFLSLYSHKSWMSFCRKYSLKQFTNIISIFYYCYVRTDFDEPAYCSIASTKSFASLNILLIKVDYNKSNYLCKLMKAQKIIIVLILSSHGGFCPGQTASATIRWFSIQFSCSECYRLGIYFYSSGARVFRSNVAICSYIP